MSYISKGILSLMRVVLGVVLESSFRTKLRAVTCLRKLWKVHFTF